MGRVLTFVAVSSDQPIDVAARRHRELLYPAPRAWELLLVV